MHEVPVDATLPHRPCGEEIIYAPFNPNTLNTHYVARAEEIFARYGSGGAKEGTPFFLYVAFAHTHTPMGYDPKWVSHREGKDVINIRLILNYGGLCLRRTAS